MADGGTISRAKSRTCVYSKNAKISSQQKHDQKRIL